MVQPCRRGVSSLVSLCLSMEATLGKTLSDTSSEKEEEEEVHQHLSVYSQGGKDEHEDAAEDNSVM